MSRKFELQAVGSSVLSADFYPPIELDKNSRYGLGLLGFYGCNTIHNVTKTNNLITFAIPVEETTFSMIYHIEIPSGAYEIEEINAVIQRELEFHVFHGAKHDDTTMDELFSLRANNNTFKCMMRSKYVVDLKHKNSIASLLGFEKKEFSANHMHESTSPVNIVPVRLIRLDCNIISGSYINDEENHILFSFDVDVEPGYNITKEPNNIIYMPISPEGRQFIDNITLRILDHQSNLIDFGSVEEIVVILELKKLQ